MSSLRDFLPFVLLLVGTLLVSACATGGGSGFGNLSSIFDEDLTAKQPRKSADGNGQVAVLGPGGIIYDGTDQPRDRGSNQTVSSFEPGEYSLNFQNADIREVVQSILGEALKENYTINPNVLGSITISSARPVSRDDLLSVLEVALRMNGADMVVDGDTYRIELEDYAVSGRTDVGDVRPGYGMTVIPLRYMSAQTMLNLVEGFGTRPGSVRAEATRNLLIVLGNSADRKAAIETALTFDADWMQDQAVAILPLRRSTPQEVIPELERIFATQEGGAGADLVQFMPMQRLRAVLVVSPRRLLIERAKVWVKRLDTEDPDVNASVHVYRVKYREAKTLAPILSQLFSGGGAGAAADAAANIEPGAEALRSDGFTQTGLNQNDEDEDDLIAGSQVAGAGPALQIGEQPEDTNVLPAGSARIQADIANNSLIIYADLNTRQEILAALRRIDVPQLQVAINVTMAEIRLNEELRYGIQYFLKSDTFHLGDDKGSFGLFDTLANNIGRQLPGFNFVLGSESSPDVIIDAFDGITDVQVLSSPSLVVLENENAKFQVGDQIPIVTRSVVSVQNPDAPVSNEIEYRDTGIILNIKPRIADNGVVTLQIGQEISSVIAGAATLTPTISNRRVESAISVVDGQTVLLGGLISEAATKQRTGIPGLHKLPGVGNLFGSRLRDTGRTELIILIRPTVIRGSEDAQHVAEELRSRLWGLGASQAR